ncbi:MAG: DUF4054 domain-containing protein [Edwardsiella phage MSW-3]|nr:MAG: DUF4054 domain-containing protein [Edwardsiella phage MSW-3]
MEITKEIIAAFRSDPQMCAFSDSVKWPDNFIAGALCNGDEETGSSRWGGFVLDDCHNFKRRGMFLFAAAWLMNNFGDGGPNVATSGEARLNVASKSIGDESVAYRVPSMMEVSDDWLTWSHYGQQFYRLRKRAGMGALAV